MQSVYRSLVDPVVLTTPCWSGQQKKADSPLQSTNPFLEDEAAEDPGSEKEEDLDRVGGPPPDPPLTPP